MVYLDGKLSDRFKYKELINPLGKSIQTREQLEPSYQIIKNAQFTLEPLEVFLQLNPELIIRPTAFFRSDDENERVGGSPTSDHKKALAIDFEVINTKTGKEENYRFVDFVDSRNVPFDQIILFNSKDAPTAIHFGRGPKMRGEKKLLKNKKYYDL